MLRNSIDNILRFTWRYCSDVPPKHARAIEKIVHVCSRASTALSPESTRWPSLDIVHFPRPFISTLFLCEPPMEMNILTFCLICPSGKVYGPFTGVFTNGCHSVDFMDLLKTLSSKQRTTQFFVPHFPDRSMTGVHVIFM